MIPSGLFSRVEVASDSLGILLRLPRFNYGARLAQEEPMDTADETRVGRIRHLNDLLRCKGMGGQVMITAGLDALGEVVVARILREIAAFTEFSGDNDPHGERDCAALTVEGTRIIWKIDYFDRDLTYHSPNPADPSVTSRIMTVMLADEY